MWGQRGELTEGASLWGSWALSQLFTGRSLNVRFWSLFSKAVQVVFLKRSPPVSCLGDLSCWHLGRRLGEALTHSSVHRFLLLPSVWAQASRLPVPGPGWSDSKPLLLSFSRMNLDSASGWWGWGQGVTPASKSLTASKSYLLPPQRCSVGYQRLNQFSPSEKSLLKSLLLCLHFCPVC